MDRTFVILGALFGLLGTAASAAAAHVTGPGSGLDTAASFLLFHAPVLLAVPVLIRSGLTRAAVARAGGLLIFAGAALFSGELALRAIEGKTLFRMAAPTGGTIILAGWLLIAVSALTARREH